LTDNTIPHTEQTDHAPATAAQEPSWVLVDITYPDNRRPTIIWRHSAGTAVLVDLPDPVPCGKHPQHVITTQARAALADLVATLTHRKQRA